MVKYLIWSNLDLSIVKINMKGLDYMKLGDSGETRIGENVYAIGNPVGYELYLKYYCNNENDEKIA